MPKNLAALHYVIDEIASYCVQSPLADDPEAYIEADGLPFTTDDLREALVDLKHHLEGLKLMSGGTFEA